MEFKKCSKCGETILESNKKCPFCGNDSFSIVSQEEIKFQKNIKTNLSIESSGSIGLGIFLGAFLDF